MDNKSEIELGDKFYVYTNKTSLLKLKKSINFTFVNSKIVQQFTKKALVKHND